MESFSARLALVGKRLFPALFVFCVALISVSGHYLPATPWLAQLEWLTPSALAVSGLIAAQFGRSRLVLLSAVLLALVLGWDIALTHSGVIMVLAGSVSWFLWRPDRGLLPVNALLTLLEAAAVGLVLYLGLPLAAQLCEPLLASVYPLLLQLGPAISGQLSAFESLFWLAMLITGLARVAWVPSNNHVAMFVCLLTLLTLQLYPETLYLLVSTLLLAAVFVVAILIDSFNMAFRDELTGIPSRRALMQFVQTLGRKYVVVMSDIDHFKKFNDTYGHDVGDQVLRLVASKLSKVTGGGRAFRYGGEEFTLIFPRKSIHEVTAHVEMIRQLIADYPIVLRGQDRPKQPPKQKPKQAPARKTVKVTCSFGIAERSADVKEFSAIMKRADQALYAAKKAGRNCVKSDAGK